MNGMFWVLFIKVGTMLHSGPIPYIFETEGACLARGLEVTSASAYQLKAAEIHVALGYSCRYRHVISDNKDGRSAIFKTDD